MKETLGFLMTRELAHFQMFSAALDSIPRCTHTYFNMSDGAGARGPWHDG